MTKHGKTPYAYVAKPPCHECADRHPGCQDHCEKYAEYAATIKKVRETRREWVHTDCYLNKKDEARRYRKP